MINLRIQLHSFSMWLTNYSNYKSQLLPLGFSFPLYDVLHSLLVSSESLVMKAFNTFLNWFHLHRWICCIWELWNKITLFVTWFLINHLSIRDLLRMRSCFSFLLDIIEFQQILETYNSQLDKCKNFLQGCDKSISHLRLQILIFQQ